jgi:tetrahydromethanopterin S-methyltransferase subunit C
MDCQQSHLILIPQLHLNLLAKIKDKTIKANLLLEYGLLTGRIKSEYIKIPITIMFPFNLSFESEENLNQTLNMLKSFCNILQISSFLNTKIYTISGKKVRSIIDGVCIKRIF